MGFKLPSIFILIKLSINFIFHILKWSGLLQKCFWSQKNKKEFITENKFALLIYWAEQKGMESFVWYYYLSFLRVYIGFLYTKRKLIKRRKKCASWGKSSSLKKITIFKLHIFLLSQRRWPIKMVYEKTKKSNFFLENAYFSALFFLKYFLVVKLTDAKKFGITIFYRKIGRKMTFEAPGTREIWLFLKFRIVLLFLGPNKYFHQKSSFPNKYWHFELRER